MLPMRLLVITFFVFQCLTTLGSAEYFDFFYFVQQWPASLCNTKSGCCYPSTGKPDEDFIINRLLPKYADGTSPKHCNHNSSFGISQISDLIDRLQEDWPSISCPSSDGTQFWSQQWRLRGSCTSFDQHTFFESALDLKFESDLLGSLKREGIYPGDSYNGDSIKKAIEKKVGYEPFIKCNTNAYGNRQLFEIYLCVDTSASKFIECPDFPTSNCGGNLAIEFPSLYSESESAQELRMVTSH